MKKHIHFSEHQQHISVTHVPAAQPPAEALTFSDFAFLGLGAFIAVLFLKAVFLSARLRHKQPSQLAVRLWLALAAIWVLTLITSFLMAKTTAGVMRGNLIAVGLTGFALIVALFNRQKANAAGGEGDTTLGDARPASRQEVANAGYVMQYDPETKTHYGNKGIPLGSYEDLNPVPERTILGIKRPTPEHIDQPWNGLRHPNTLFYNSPGHLITVAPTQSGKGRDALIPALLSDGLTSTVVIDPKGQLAAITARARMEAGQKVYCLNPFGLHADRLPPSVGFNPMADLEPSSPAFGVDCDSIAIAQHVFEKGSESHWNASSMNLCAGLSMYLAKYGEPGLRNLAAVRSLIASPPKVFRAVIDAAMATGDQLIIERLSRFAGMTDDDREAQGIISTARTQTAFLSNDAIRRSVSGAGFSVDDLRSGKGATVYLILPGEYIDTCKKWFRLVIDSLLRGLMKNQKGNEVVMILDEFANLGHLGSIETAMALAAGYGVKLWPILQDLNQLKELYRDKWETFLANSGAQQFFTPRDQTTADYISKRCGQMTVKVANKSMREVSAHEAAEGMSGVSHSQSTQARELFLPQDILGMSGDRQLLFMTGVSHVVVGHRYPYWEWPEFKGKYDADPYHS